MQRSRRRKGTLLSNWSLSMVSIHWSLNGSRRRSKKLLLRIVFIEGLFSGIVLQNTVSSLAATCTSVHQERCIRLTAARVLMPTGNASDSFPIGSEEYGGNMMLPTFGRWPSKTGSFCRQHRFLRVAILNSLPMSGFISLSDLMKFEISPGLAGSYQQTT